MPLQGDVATVPLRDVLGWLANRRASGTLSLSRGMVVRQFHLRDGRVMLSSSTDQEMLLGRLLVARGIVDREQLQTALEQRAGSRFRLGTLLTRAGMVSIAQLRDVLNDKVRLLLLDALTWTDGDFFFDAVTMPKRSAVSAIVALADVLAEPPPMPIESVDADDVVVADDDIIEIIELARPRRTRAAKSARRKVATVVAAQPPAAR